MRALYVTGAIAALTVGLIIGGVLWWRSYHEFDSAKWKAVGTNVNCENDVRLRMVSDLRADHVHKGMEASEVRRLLGKPLSTTRYPDRQAERQDRYFLRHSKRLFGMTRSEYIEAFGRPDDAPQEGFAWEWSMGVSGSDCDWFYIRFVNGRVVEFG